MFIKFSGPLSLTFGKAANFGFRRLLEKQSIHKSARRELFSWHNLSQGILEQYEILSKLKSFYEYF